MSVQYKNTKTGDICVFETACHIKIGDNWVNGVAYFNANKLRKMFVITEDDFFSSFEEIVDEVEL